MSKIKYDRNTKGKLERMFEQKASELRKIVMSEFMTMSQTSDAYHDLFHEKWDNYLNSFGCTEDIEGPFITLHNPGSGGSYLRIPLEAAETALALGGLPGFP